MILASLDSASSFLGEPVASMVFGLGIEKNRIGADGKNARQLVGDDNNGRAQRIAQTDDQIVQQPGADRIESGRRFVEEQNLGIERHGPGQTGSFLHAAADLGRVIILESRQTDQSKLVGYDVADFTVAHISELAQRQGDIFGQRQGTEQGAALV